MTGKKRTEKILPLLKVAMFLLVTIGIAMVMRRLVILTGLMPANNKPGFGSLDQGFNKHSFTTILHIVPGAVFMILGPLQFMSSIRLGHIQFHRWSGRVFILAAYIIGITSTVLSFTKQSTGGLTEAVASVFFSIFFLVCVSLSLYYILRKQVLLHREWMIRAFSLGLAISTVRLIAVFTFIVFKVPLQSFLGIAFWMGFTLHTIVAEIWINYTRKPDVTTRKAPIFPDVKKETVHQ